MKDSRAFYFRPTNQCADGENEGVDLGFDCKTLATTTLAGLVWIGEN